MTLALKYLVVVASLMLMIGVLRIVFMIRARAMRAFATRWGLHYVGPTAPNLWGFGRFPKVKPPLPASFPRVSYPVGPMRQAWNLIEGRKNGLSVVICDSVLGYRTYCTIIGCQTVPSPFTTAMSSEHIIRYRDWVVLCRVRYLQIIPWTLGIQRLEHHLTELGGGSIHESSSEPRPPNTRLELPGRRS